MDPMTAAEFRQDEHGTITLHLNGTPRPMMGQADVRGVRNAGHREAVLAALDGAVRDGARHGECDQAREMAAMLKGEPVPGCIRYESDRTDYGWVVTRADSHADPEEILHGGKPYYSGADVANALRRAFIVGGRFGHPDVDGYARPLPLSGGAALVAVEIDADIRLQHIPARAYSVECYLHGTRVIARLDGDDVGGYAVYRRYNGTARTPDGDVVSRDDERARWQVAAQMTPEEYRAWDGEATGRATPARHVTRWLDRVAALAPYAPQPA